MLNDGGKFIVHGSWEMQVVKLVRILRVEVVSCFTPFKKVLFYFHTKSLKEKKRERGQGENVGLLQVISKFYKSYSSKTQELSIVNTEEAKKCLPGAFFYTKSLKEKKRARREGCAFADHFKVLQVILIEDAG
jgi:hypothetical protein